MGIIAKSICIGRGSLLFVALLSIAACSTVSPDQVTTFGHGVDAAKLQTDTTFAGINEMVTAEEVNRAVRLSKLTEDDVAVVLPAKSISQWDRTFDVIHLYVANLTLLISPDRAKDFSTATESLASSLGKLDPKLFPSPGVASGFTELGRLLIEAKAASDARQAALTVDPAMQQIFPTMASAIGASNDQQGGLRKLVWGIWEERLDSQSIAFSRASVEARRPAVLTYIDLRDKRDAQDLQMASLHQSYLDLAAAHSALARGSNIDLTAAVDRLQQELEATRALQAQFTSLKPKAEEK